MIVNTARIPGIMARRNVNLKAWKRIPWCRIQHQHSRAIMASSGPATAPVWSIARWNPYALPLMLSSAAEAISASLGAVRIPFPHGQTSLSRNLPCRCHKAGQGPDQRGDGYIRQDTRQLSFADSVRYYSLISLRREAVVFSYPFDNAENNSSDPRAFIYTGMSG